jgi:hypothetical protein
VVTSFLCAFIRVGVSHTLEVSRAFSLTLQTPKPLLYLLSRTILLLHQILLYVVDGAGGDSGGSGGNEPASDLRSLWKELKLYDERLLQKPAMLFVNKSDLECKMHVTAQQMWILDPHPHLFNGCHSTLQYLPFY